MKLLKKLSAVVVGAPVLLSAVPALAQAAGTSVDYSSLTSSVDFSAVGTALLAVGGSIILLLVSIAGIRHVVRFVRGA